MNWFNRVQWTRCAAGVILISTVAGCKRDEGTVYTVPKDNSPPSQPAPMATPETAPPPAAMSLPQLQYQLPEGWQEKAPAEMRVASFTALGTNGLSADVSVIPLPIVGKDLELVNMWRSQVQLPATSDPDAVKQAEPVAIGADQGRLFNFVSDQPMIGNARQRILVAMLTRGTMSWFFKMTGEDTFVTSQKDNFIQFLKSVSFVENAPAEAAAAPATQGENQNAGSIWTIPSGWQTLPPSQFLLAEYAVTGTNGAKADVNVAELGGEGGGLAANVNRWRGQLGLPAAGETDFSKSVSTLDIPGGQASLVDLTGTDSKTGKPARLVGVILPQNGRTWFYKLMGDPEVVAQQKDAFIKFIQSAKYPNAP
ncbi:MAG TPA: hypothetical protein VHX90_02815 [Verrucomicrobiae bacterium]|nr:hypothetical protein [Verrucomicrobiae bacterium]